MKNRRNYYRMLHVQPDAPEDIIKASYRTLMQKLKMHPDLGGDEWNAALLNEAYSILCDSAKRAAYDAAFRRDYKVNQTPTKADASKSPRRDPRPEQSAVRPGQDDRLCPFCRTPKPVGFQYGNVRCCTRCASPLQTEFTWNVVGDSQRTLQRIVHHAPVMFFTTVTDPFGQRGTIDDLSPRGLKFQCSDPLADNRIIKIVCDALSATARVSYCRYSKADGRYKVGVEFLTLQFSKQSGIFLSEKT